MNGEWVMDLIIEAAWKSAFVAGAALLLLLVLKRRSAAERACVAHLGMAAMLLLPVLLIAGPRLEVLPAVQEAPVAAVSAPAVPFVEEETAPAFADATAETAPAYAVNRATALTWGYALPAALLLLLTLVAILRLFALRGRANVIVQQGWVSALAHAQRRMGIKSGTALLVSRELSSPVSWGVMRPVILLNEEALEAADDAEAIIAHELAHVARFDWLNLLVARIATALFWFNPLVWLLARLGHQLREEAADDAVLRAEVPNADYAALLVGAARHEGKSLLLAAHGVAPSKGSLSMRVHRILEPTAARTPARLAWAGGATLAMVAVAGPLAALSPAPTPVAAAPMIRTPDGTATAALPAPPAGVTAAAAPAAPAAPDALSPAPAVAPPVPVTAVPNAAPVANSAPPAPSTVAAATATAIATATAAAAGAAEAVASAHQPFSPEALVALRVHGVRAGDAADYAAASPRLRNLSSDQLVSLRIHGVSPARVREYGALGYPNLSAERLVEWGVHGVSPSFIRGINDAGYRNLTPDRLTEFRIHGITPGFIRELRGSGVQNLTAERVVDIRITGERPVTVSRPRVVGARSRHKPPGD